MDLIFEENVRKCFDSVLYKYGFVCISSNRRFVHYESDKVYVDVSYDRERSFEVNLFFGLKDSSNDDDNPAFTIGSLLKFKNIEKKEKYRGLQASSQSSLLFSIKKLAKILEENGDEFLKGDKRAFSLLEEFYDQDNFKYNIDRELRYARRNIDKAWQEKDYQKIINLYSPLESFIKPSEKKKLEYAKKHICK